MSRRLGNRLCIIRRPFALAIVAGTVLLALCLPPSSSVSGLPSSTRQPQQETPLVDVVDSGTQGLTLDVTVPAPVEQQVQQQATTYQRLSLPGAGSTSEIGQPELPSFGRFVAIPKGAQAQVQILADQLETRSGYLLYPAQEPQVEQGEEPPFTLDAAAYQRDEFRPSEIVTTEGPYIVRGVEVVLVRFHAVQYNAARRTLSIHSSFRVAVSFVGGGPILADERLRSPYFEPLLASTLLNYAELGAPLTLGSGLGGTTGCDYLIIAAPHLVDQANLLADWKIRRGLDTCVRTTSQTGSTASAIKSYIQNAYDFWSPPPSFVLLLGDAEFIPTNYVTVHPEQEPSGSLIASDLYYATVDGTDYFPDISTGRISVDTASQAYNIINKIINYERNPPYTASFYSTVALAAYFQDDDLDTYEDRDWVRTSEDIGSYLGSIRYDEIRIYYAEPEPWGDPQFYRDGTPLPFYLLRSNGFPWIGNTAEIVNWVNSGTLILNHRDHGWRMMWAVPELQVSHVLGLTNRNRLPMVFSMNCETGWFDNETDDWRHGTDYYEVTFAEAWQRNQNGGASGIVAPTRLSYSGYNDYLDKGLIDAIWPDFLPHARSGSFSSPQYRMGPALEYAKLYMATVYGESTNRKITFEMFHYFGDPAMEIWTAEPSSMAVYHSPIYYAGPTPFTVEVEDGALVSLVRDGEIVATAISTGGTATFTSLASLTPGGVYLTVTKHNRRPFESSVLVLTEGMVPDVYLPLVCRR